MKRHGLHFKDQKGDASLLVTLLLGLSVSGVVYYNLDHVNQQQKAQNIQRQKDRTETRGISGLSQATALLQFRGSAPQADDPNGLPYIYPDPYLGYATMGVTRPHPTVETWNYSQKTLNILSPSDGSLNGDAFASLVGNGARPNFGSRSQIKFLNPIYDSTHPNLIKSYQTEVTATSASGQPSRLRASLPVPPMAPPKCILRSATGDTEFQPNSPMDLQLIVSGVSTEALIPDTTAALAHPDDLSNYNLVNISEKANSVVKMNHLVHSWTVMAPRPLVAVDGTEKVKFTVTAFLRSIDNNSWGNISCAMDYWVTAPATCKLWVDKSSVPPGECVDIKADSFGPVVAGSLVLTATDSGNKSVGGISQTGSKSGRFCTPNSTFVPEVTVPAKTASTYASMTAGYLQIHLEAIKNALDDHREMVKTTFAAQPDLKDLTIREVNALANLSNTQIDEIDTLNFSSISGFSGLNSKEIDALRTVPTATIKALNINKLNTIKVLQSLNKPQISQLDSIEASSPLYFSSYIAKTIADLNTSIDYVIRGQISSTESAAKSSCLVHVTAGTNDCPFYGPNFPNYCVNRPLHVANSDGTESWQNVDFCPTDPAYEVAGVATSPTTVTPCPPDARCYALGQFGGRTPFVTVQPAKASTCDATMSLRLDLGCFAFDTKIRMADGSDRSIQLLKDGDLIFNPLTHQKMPIKRIISGPEALTLLRIQTSKGEVRVTRQHPMLTKQGLIAASLLKVGDEITDGLESFTLITAIEQEAEPPRLTVWNFEINTSSQEQRDHAVLANGIVTGDLYLQEKLAAKQSRWSRVNP